MCYYDFSLLNFVLFYSVQAIRITTISDPASIIISIQMVEPSHRITPTDHTIQVAAAAATVVSLNLRSFPNRFDFILVFIHSLILWRNFVLNLVETICMFDQTWEFFKTSTRARLDVEKENYAHSTPRTHMFIVKFNLRLSSSIFQ